MWYAASIPWRVSYCRPTFKQGGFGLSARMGTHTARGYTLTARIFLLGEVGTLFCRSAMIDSAYRRRRNQPVRPWVLAACGIKEFIRAEVRSGRIGTDDLSRPHQVISRISRP